ncbi:hypothetical protein MMC07_008233 [Pseudocyphellaria aurata]|nr:hypothetical protein [Pseudocyphellaria aurata]
MYVEPISRLQPEFEEYKVTHLKDGELRNGRKEDLMFDRQLPSPLWQPAKALPAGWEKQWVFDSQRWKYIETATGDSQWDWPASPGFLPLGHDPPRGSPSPGVPGLDGGYIDAHGDLSGGESGGRYAILLGKPHVPGGQFGEQYSAAEKTEKDKDHDPIEPILIQIFSIDEGSSDGEHSRPAAQKPQDYAQQPGPPGTLPAQTSSASVKPLPSDKVNGHEAREKHENASATDKEQAREE